MNPVLRKSMIRAETNGIVRRGIPAGTNSRPSSQHLEGYSLVPMNNPSGAGIGERNENESQQEGNFPCVVLICAFAFDSRLRG